MLKDTEVIAFFEGLRAKILFEKELVDFLNNQDKFSGSVRQGIRDFLQTFKDREIFGQNYSLFKKSKAIKDNLVRV